MDKSEDGFLLKNIMLKIFINLNGSNRRQNCSELVRKVGCTYSHGVKLLNKLEDIKLICFIKEGREKAVVLTQAGSDVGKCLIRIKDIVPHKSL